VFCALVQGGLDLEKRHVRRGLLSIRSGVRSAGRWGAEQCVNGSAETEAQQLWHCRRCRKRRLHATHDNHQDAGAIPKKRLAGRVVPLARDAHWRGHGVLASRLPAVAWAGMGRGASSDSQGIIVRAANHPTFVVDLFRHAALGFCGLRDPSMQSCRRCSPEVLQSHIPFPSRPCRSPSADSQAAKKFWGNPRAAAIGRPPSAGGGLFLFLRTDSRWRRVVSCGRD
jgi:hypothetical protein